MILDPVEVVAWQHLLGARLFRVRSCDSKTIIPNGYVKHFQHPFSTPRLLILSVDSGLKPRLRRQADEMMRNAHSGVLDLAKSYVAYQGIRDVPTPMRWSA